MYQTSSPDFERKVAAIPALFTQRHAHIIYGLIRWFRPQTVIEVGAFCGYLTAWISRAIEDNENDGQVIAIDDYSLNNSPQAIINNLATLGLANNLRVIIGKSQEVYWPQCELAVIDGDHSYEGAKADFVKALEVGAEVCVFHDSISWWGVHKLIEELRASEEFDVLETFFDEGLAIVTKRVQPRPLPRYTEKEYPSGSV